MDRPLTALLRLRCARHLPRSSHPNNRTRSLFGTVLPSSNLQGPAFQSAFSSCVARPAKLGRIPIRRVPASEAVHASPPTLAAGFPEPHPRLRPSIWRPALFCALTSGLSFAGAVYLTNRDTAHWRAILKDKSVGFFGRAEPTDVQLAHATRVGTLAWVERQLGDKVSRPLAVAVNWWMRLSDGKQTALILVAANAAVFLAWQVPRVNFQKHMARHWLHYPLSGRSHTILTSTFSHSSALHFGFNMFALYSFGSATEEFLSRRFRKAHDITEPSIPESTSRWHFLAFIVTTGLAAGLASHSWSLLVRAPRLLKWQQGKLATQPSPILPSLGISGAVYGCLTATAIAAPDAQVSLIFLPMMPISIGPAVAGIMTLDLIGLLRGWRMFDHAAHFVGGLFGVFWITMGAKWFDIARSWSWPDVARAAEQERAQR